jgi:hypothetical protein
MRIRVRRIAMAAAAVMTVAAGLAVNGIASGTTTSSVEPSQFTVTNGTIRPATGTPVPASGTHASLWGNISYATTTIEGSGRVVVGAIGNNCDGWPTVRVSVDGQVTGEVTMNSNTRYGAYPVGTSVGGGRHTVVVQFINDFASSTCDRNVHIGSARMENPGPFLPGPSNTGVPPGTPLEVHNGDLTITRDNDVIDGLDVYGFVTIRANNVTIRNTRIRGRETTTGRALIQAWDGFTNLVVEDSTLRADFPSRFVDGLIGYNFTARRIQASNVVDTSMITGVGNVAITDSYFFGTLHVPDDRRSDGWTHDDNLQIEGGSNILVQNNRFEGSVNAAIMVTTNTSQTRGVRVIGNRLSDGGCTINLSETRHGTIVDFLVQDNRFGTSRNHPCGVIAPSTSRPQMVNNFYLDGTPVTVRRGA